MSFLPQRLNSTISQFYGNSLALSRYMFLATNRLTSNTIQKIHTSHPRVDIPFRSAVFEWSRHQLQSNDHAQPENYGINVLILALKSKFMEASNIQFFTRIYSKKGKETNKLSSSRNRDPGSLIETFASDTNMDPKWYKSTLRDYKYEWLRNLLAFNTCLRY